MGILSLPPEIVVETLSYLESLQDVSSLSRSCRQMHGLCNMPVRKKFHLIRVWPNNRGIEQAFDLVMEILKQPHLGRYVREIRYYGRPRHAFVWGSEINGKNSRKLPESEMHLLIKAIKRAGFLETEWEEVLSMAIQKTTGCETGKWIYYNGMNTPFTGPHIAQALAVILISMAPNLVLMGMTQPFASWSSQEENFPLKAFLSQANKNSDILPYLQSLRRVYMIVDQAGELDEPGFYTHIEFLNCFDLFDKLPSIVSVGIDTLTDDQQDEPEIEQRQSDLTELCITHSNVSTHYIARAILACKVLKRFQYSVGGREELDVKYFNKKTLVKALFTHKASLETLDIDAEIEGSWWRQKDNPKHPLPQNDRDNEDLFEDGDENDSYHDFLDHSGKTLSVGSDLLFYLIKRDIQLSRERKNVKLVDGLPDNLEFLCIRGYERGKFPSWDQEIDALIAAFNSGAINLTDIRGVDETIPPSAHVYRPDEQWTLDEIGYAIECDVVIGPGLWQALYLIHLVIGLVCLKYML
ncbi:uncharacterized protein N7483_007400 [Penicillium malachiteum]|uniref:uncharacterized protein n=1 Tax=Penicillium malachiteum TaxID=1324776 RepID=UPI00254801C8|nr:uncharacterized protein N7483_007400 [Penicillium malachiteum]KAJ5726043.1 hypothetical protein N7483_007400 [Penicillium malachiteum]